MVSHSPINDIIEKIDYILKTQQHVLTQEDLIKLAKARVILKEAGSTPEAWSLDGASFYKTAVKAAISEAIELIIQLITS